MIVVMGLYRGGSSAVAGVLHHLGVCMGHNLKSVPGYCTYEDWSIRNACVRCYSEPVGQALLRHENRVAVLRDWLEQRQCTCPVMGVKYPMLCGMIPEMLEAWGTGHQIVRVRREPEAVRLSVRRWWSDAGEQLVDWLGAERDTQIASDPGLTPVDVRYERLCADPTGEVERLARELGLNPSNDQLEDAAAFVHRPEEVPA